MSASDFKIVRPLAIAGGILSSTNIPESVAATYSTGTTYAAGALAGLAPTYGQPQIVWASKKNGNLNHPQVVGEWWRFAGIVYPAYNSGSSCNKGGIVTDLTNHVLYESLVDSNTGNPLTDRTKWLNIGPTNAWAMFDDVYGSQSSSGEEIVFELTPGTIINTLFLGNLSGVEVTVSQSVSGWTETKSLIRHPVTNWYDFYYETPIQDTDVLFEGIPPVSTGVLTVKISAPAGTAKCGLCVAGKSARIGTTVWEVFGGILSYSGTTTDAFGNTKFLRRQAAKKLNLDIMIDAGFETEAHRLLTQYTDMPLVCVGTSEYGMAMVYGHIKSFSVPLSITGRPAPLEIHGLI
jgi:hypothetical protein